MRHGLNGACGLGCDLLNSRCSSEGHSRAIALTATPAVYTRNGTAYASSRDVAAFFEKQHKNVVRDIRVLIEDAPSIGLNFEPVDYRDAKGELRPAYEMTRDGFTLLAMGFTGKTALAFKVRYIEEFNRMEAQLKAPVQPNRIKEHVRGAVRREDRAQSSRTAKAGYLLRGASGPTEDACRRPRMRG